MILISTLPSFFPFNRWTFLQALSCKSSKTESNHIFTSAITSHTHVGDALFQYSSLNKNNPPFWFEELNWKGQFLTNFLKVQAFETVHSGCKLEINGFIYANSFSSGFHIYMLRKCLLKGSEFECWNQGILHCGYSTDWLLKLSNHAWPDHHEPSQEGKGHLSHDFDNLEDIVGKKWEPRNPVPGPFSAKIRKVNQNSESRREFGK